MPQSDKNFTYLVNLITLIRSMPWQVSDILSPCAKVENRGA